MARDFVKDVNNVMNLGARTLTDLLSGVTAVSFHAWINMDTTSSTGNGNNRVLSFFIEGGSNSIRVNIDNLTNPGQRQIRVAGRSVITDSLQARLSTTDIPLSTWVSVGGVLDFTGDAITPYYNGTAENGGAVTFANSTLTPGGAVTANDSIGAQDGATTTAVAAQMDGRIAEVALWGGDIGAAGYAALAKGVSPLLVRPDLLYFYMPLVGNNSPETDIISAKNGTIIGTLAKADHPRVIYPANYQIAPFAAGGGSSASSSISPSTSPSVSVSPSTSPSASISPSRSVSPSVSPSASTSPSVSISPSVSPSASVSPSVSISPSTSPSASISPSSSVSPSTSPSASVSPSVSPSVSVSPSTSPSSSTSPSRSVSPSVSPSSSVSPSPSPSISPSASVSPSPSPSASPSAPPNEDHFLPLLGVGT